LVGCSDGCSNTTVSELESPDGLHRAILFQRGCGATTGFSTQISIVAADDRLSGGGNVFVADDDNSIAKATAWGGPWAEMAWEAPDRLHVNHDRRARIFVQNHSVSDVRISYRAVDPSSMN